MSDALLKKAKREIERRQRECFLRRDIHGPNSSNYRKAHAALVDAETELMCLKLDMARARGETVLVGAA